MKRRTVAGIFIAVLSISMLISGCGKKDNGENKNSEGIQTESETGTENIGTEETGTEEQVHTCDYVTVASDETNHWYVCSCGATANSAAHAYDNDTDATCDACGFTRNVHVCDYASLASDGNNHWNVCSCGSTANVAAHNYDNDSDATCNTCGFTREVHVCNFGTLQTDANNHWYVCSCGATANVAAHNYDSEYDGNCNVCGFTRSVPEKPLDLAPGETAEINFTGGTMDLPYLGLTIHKLPRFNNVGIMNDGSINDNWWTGTTPLAANPGMNMIYFTCDDIARALLDKGVIGHDSSAFTVSRNQIEWRYENGYAKPEFKLTRDVGNGYYVLEINRSLKDAPWGVLNLADYNKDIVKALCSFISSEPETLFNYIYGCMYEDSDVYPIYCSKYITVGDCKLKLDNTFWFKENYCYVKFYIAPL